MNFQMQPTPANQWKRTVIVQLPSGNIAELRPVSSSTFARSGRIPDALTSMTAEEAGDAAKALQSKSTKDLLIAEAEFGDEILLAAFVSPRVVRENPQEGEITLDDIDPGDRQFVTGLFERPIKELESFRPQQADDVPARAGAEGNGDAGE